jgi:hypothetical protein
MWRGWCDEDCVGTPIDSGSPRHSEDWPTIDGLAVGIIPHRAFPLRKWYYANPLWYYHAPALEHRLNTDREFYQRVDPSLRELCGLVLAAGLCTTPSCQGHFYPRVRFERVWEELVREADLARSTGLIIKDSETHASFRFADPAYHLPWPRFDDFHQAAAAQHNRGYLGIAVPSDRMQLVNAPCSDPDSRGAWWIELDDELTRILGQPLVGIHVRAGSPEQRDAAWRAVTDCVRRALAAS